MPPPNSLLPLPDTLRSSPLRSGIWVWIWLTTSAAALRTEGHNVATVTFDVTARSAIESAVAHIEAEVAPIDIPVPDPGLARRGNPSEEQR